MLITISYLNLCCHYPTSLVDRRRTHHLAWLAQERHGGVESCAGAYRLQNSPFSGDLIAAQYTIRPLSKCVLKIVYHRFRNIGLKTFAILSILRLLLMCGFGRFIFVAGDQLNGLMELCDKLPVPGVVTRDFQDREATWLRFPKTDSCYVAAVRGPSGAGPAGDQLEGTIRWASLFATPPDFLA